MTHNIINYLLQKLFYIHYQTTTINEQLQNLDFFINFILVKCRIKE